MPEQAPVFNPSITDMHTARRNTLLAGATLSKLDYNYTTPKKENKHSGIANEMPRRRVLQSKTRGHVENATIHEKAHT